ncbi:hypothetical protein HanRHA438_Chr03g0133381 [Helianthus annuus]|uniref:Uncharacterized protein n=1 Tax=Helianthus annuus TaxID=4232 RepID=A0A9K3NWP3_HELAN|nr:hypothetical protein HanXRQr2_Chr03g0121531 [Helianthus annuus]KAJ0593790.1 hypothetical protein HanHA300_Chr03g0101451 [Helianthus annuus]KAJ0608815.1 hypothetical protein HanHA89_Chr03g0113151 [Helianthus annuus]KAJ0936635.1 hypothetical protein HanRHA438_Chr03g0133381 [Helianthus annuus]
MVVSYSWLHRCLCIWFLFCYDGIWKLKGDDEWDVIMDRVAK